ncbi:MAG TPA: hypothetical protein PKN52_00200 [Trueperaceae bacterium]|nr:hypothetical protein [Trueperaceae bacterium]
MRGPEQPEPLDPVHEAAGKVVEALSEYDLQVALTVLTNVCGQVVAALAEGRPSEVQRQGTSLAENIKRAAIAKLLHDDEQRRSGT